MLARPPSALKSGLQLPDRPTSAAESGEQRLGCYPNATQERLAGSRDLAAIAGLFTTVANRPSALVSSGYPRSVRTHRQYRPANAVESGRCRQVPGPFRDLPDLPPERRTVLRILARRKRLGRVESRSPWRRPLTAKQMNAPPVLPGRSSSTRENTVYPQGAKRRLSTPVDLCYWHADGTQEPL